MELNTNEVVVLVVALAITIILGVLLKRYTNHFRRPNGKKGGGLVSLHTVIAFAILSVITISFQNVYLTILTVILAYMIARQRIVDQQHYFYQVFFGALLGMIIPYIVYSVLDKESISKLTHRFGKMPSTDREPETEQDQRHQADEHPELAIPDDDLEYI